MADPIRDNVALSRFELDLDADVAIVTYRLLPGAITSYTLRFRPE